MWRWKIFSGKDKRWSERSNREVGNRSQTRKEAQENQTAIQKEATRGKRETSGSAETKSGQQVREGEGAERARKQEQVCEVRGQGHQGEYTLGLTEVILFCKCMILDVLFG